MNISNQIADNTIAIIAILVFSLAAIVTFYIAISGYQAGAEFTVTVGMFLFSLIFAVLGLLAKPLVRIISEYS